MEIWDPEKEETIVFLTNHLGFGATTIALYGLRGLPPAPLVEVRVELKSGNIRDSSGHLFPGEGWRYFIAEDTDGDGWGRPAGQLPHDFQP